MPLSLYTDSLYLYFDISLSISLCWNPHPTHWGLLWLHPPCLLKQQQRQQEEKQCINSLKNNLNNKNLNKNSVVATQIFWKKNPPRKVGKRWNPFWLAHIFFKWLGEKPPPLENNHQTQQQWQPFQPTNPSGDRLALHKVVTSMARNSLKSPMAECLLIRCLAKTDRERRWGMKSDESWWLCVESWVSIYLYVMYTLGVAPWRMTV